MKHREIIKAIQGLDETEQSWLKEFFNQSLASFSASESVLKKFLTRNTKRDIPASIANQPMLSALAN